MYDFDVGVGDVQGLTVDPQETSHKRVRNQSLGICPVLCLFAIRYFFCAEMLIFQHDFLES